jgi:hypothetical protein
VLIAFDDKVNDIHHPQAKDGEDEHAKRDEQMAVQTELVPRPAFQRFVRPQRSSVNLPRLPSG